MNAKQIKRFFEAYKYPIDLLEHEGQIIDVWNPVFKISLSLDGNYYYSAKLDGKRYEYDIEASPDCLYSMLITGWSDTQKMAKLIFETLQQEVRNEIDQEIIGLIKI